MDTVGAAFGALRTGLRFGKKKDGKGNAAASVPAFRPQVCA